MTHSTAFTAFTVFTAFGASQDNSIKDIQANDTCAKSAASQIADVKSSQSAPINRVGPGPLVVLSYDSIGCGTAAHPRPTGRAHLARISGPPSQGMVP